MQNWPSNLTYSAANYHYPESVEQLQEIVSHAKHVSVIGTRHSFTDIADTAGDLISLEKMPTVFELDTVGSCVTVNANLTYIELSDRLNAAGYALHNLASLPHISVIGACMTATHGSGNQSGSLATAVIGVEMVTASGDLVQLSREKAGPTFEGVVVALGALGIVLRVTLEIQPAYQMRQYFYQVPHVETLEAGFDGIMSSQYSVSIFTQYGGERPGDILVKERLNGETAQPISDTLFGAKVNLDWPEEPAMTPKLIPGDWHLRLPHFQPNGLAAIGNELQTEYIIPREHAPAAIAAVKDLHSELLPTLNISEIRTVAADQMWMSPFYERDGVCIHFTWHPDPAGVERLMPLIEARLAPFDPRPHWGKLFSIPAEQIRQSYPKFKGFKALVEAHDPNRKFCNRYLQNLLFD